MSACGKTSALRTWHVACCGCAPGDDQRWGRADFEEQVGLRVEASGFRVEGWGG